MTAVLLESKQVVQSLDVDREVKLNLLILHALAELDLLRRQKSK